MRIITDSAADFTNEELKTFDVECVRTQVMIGNKSYNQPAIARRIFEDF